MICDGMILGAGKLCWPHCRIVWKPEDRASSDSRAAKRQTASAGSPDQTGIKLAERKPKALIADKGCDSNDIRNDLKKTRV